MSRADVDLRHVRLSVGEVCLHAVEAGEGPLVLLLHGFPDFWYSWRYQIPALVQAGYRVVAPDLRGHNLSDKPAGLDAYTLPVLARDVVGLVSALEAPRASIVGHDWGGLIAWQVAMQAPEVVDRLVILNAPHPSKAQEALRWPAQWLKSAYILFFQLPGLPERLLQAGDFALVRQLWRLEPRQPVAEADIARYVAAMRQPGALTSALNYYRALLQRPLSRAPLRRIEAPTLVLWGERDLALDRRLAEPDRTWVPHLQVMRFPEASHWVQLDAPEAVNTALIQFLGQPEAGT